MPMAENTEFRATIAELRTLLDRLESALVAANDDDGVPDVESWYADRAATVPYSTEQQDLEAALASGHRVGRARIRELRRAHTPAQWRRPGRRRG
jgi:hypothetical protein